MDSVAMHNGAGENQLGQRTTTSHILCQVIRPCAAFEKMRTLGSPLSPQPIVEIVSTRRLDGRKCIHGVGNTKLASIKNQIL
ncbi:unnamed protein product [Leptosia nina]|uniref:Uncharacterized protein n=1 Tax=Leptosia nina TaxID=320188 RepID=A0AAV1JY26_9NEOP